MVERVRNVIKRDKKKTKRPLEESRVDSEPKRTKKGQLLRRYPVNNLVEVEEGNTQTLEKHRSAIVAELGKSKPRDSVLLPLLRSTYGERRMFVLNEATSVQAILEKHPALRRPAAVRLCGSFVW